MASVIGLKEYNCRAVVVVQLAERSLPTPEIRSSNPDIGNEIYQTYLSVNCYHEKTKIKIKASGMNLKKNIVAAHGHAGPLVMTEFKTKGFELTRRRSKPLDYNHHHHSSNIETPLVMPGFDPMALKLLKDRANQRATIFRFQYFKI